MSRMRGCGSAPAAVLLAAAAAVLAACAAPAAGAPPATYAIDFVVEIPAPGSGTARVRWEAAGLDDIAAFTLRFGPERFRHLRASGTLAPRPDGSWRWTPGGPYGHLSYEVRIAHERAPGKGFDSYAGPDWVVTRARALFPRIGVEPAARPGLTPRSRSRLIFRLPAGWRSATALEPLGAHAYRLAGPGRMLDRPRGWFALGKIAVDREDIGGTLVQVARAPGSRLDPAALFEFLGPTLPLLQRLLGTRPARLLIASAPDPMWRGGLSGENSAFLHGARRLRTADRTSPYLHELFHVLQPFRTAADADWVGEGLAEYYSLELQRRAGLIEDRVFERGLALFARYGLWHVDLTGQQDNAATNNSAPLVMYALDQRLQRATAGKRRLDDVVTQLAAAGGVVDTARFRRTAEAVAGKPLERFFARHVTRGEPPSLGRAQ